ncbi:MAG: tetratricopeptide repeat protein [Chloroflexi bacterium]|nr:tetratricopeptide repeat protein [Chloroflexota bacterium]
MTYSLLEVAQAVLDAGQVEEALDLLGQHLAAAPQDAEGLRLRAALLARLPGRDADALRDLAQIAAPLADDRRLAARLHHQMGDRPAACAMLTALWEAEGDPRDAETLLRILLDSGQAAEALRLLESLPNIWTWDIWRGDAHAALGDAGAARRFYRAALDAMPESALNQPLRAYLNDRLATSATCPS